MIKILLTGAHGMLGRTLCTELQPFELVPLGHLTMDISNAHNVEETLNFYHPDVVIHCAAVTAVDACESAPDRAWKVNALGSANVAAACHRNGIRLIAISTDYVFAGDADRPYHEFDMPTGGCNVYSRSKWAGEQAVRAHCPNHIIARTSWLYGHGGPSFVHTMLRLADGGHDTLKVVNDQRGNPTSATALAHALHNLVLHPELVGTFHLSCEGEASWYDFACAIFELTGKKQQVVACSSEEYPTPARRPHNSCLEKKMLALTGLPPMPAWRDALQEFLCVEKNMRYDY